MQGVHEALGAELLKGQKIEQHLAAPAEQESIDGTAVFEALQGGT